MDIRLADIQVKLPQSGKKLFSISKMEIPFGSTLFIQGASGKGKTTLLHLIAGLFLPDAGDVFINGQRLNSLSDRERARLRRRHMALLFQKLNLIDYLTALENVQLALPKKHAGSRIAIQALDDVNLQGRYHDRCAYLSLGEQQRVAAARVLAAGADIILADEPTSSLDAANGTLIMDALFRAATNKTLVVVSHDLRFRDRFKQTLQFEELTEK